MYAMQALYTYKCGGPGNAEIAVAAAGKAPVTESAELLVDREELLGTD